METMTFLKLEESREVMGGRLYPPTADYDFKDVLFENEKYINNL